MFNEIQLQPSRYAIADENRRMRRLRITMDLTTAVLRQQALTETEARSIIAGARQTALNLFPGSEGTFDLILAPRFERILRERGIVPPSGRS